MLNLNDTSEVLYHMNNISLKSTYLKLVYTGNRDYTQRVVYAYNKCQICESLLGYLLLKVQRICWPTIWCFLNLKVKVTRDVYEVR